MHYIKLSLMLGLTPTWTTMCAAGLKIPEPYLTSRPWPSVASARWNPTHDTVAGPAALLAVKLACVVTESCRYRISHICGNIAGPVQHEKVIAARK